MALQISVVIRAGFDRMPDRGVIVARRPRVDPETLVRLKMRRAYGLLFCVLAVICALVALGGPLWGLQPWPAIVLFFGSLMAGGLLTVGDVTALTSLIKTVRGSK